MSTITIATIDPHPLRTYLGRVGRALMAPTRFFREDFPYMSGSEVISFGLVGAWAASLVSFAMRTVSSLVLVQIFDDWVQSFLSSDTSFSFLAKSGNSFLWEAAFVILAPFFFLLQAFLGTLLTYLFVNLFIESSDTAPEPISFRGVFRLHAASLAGEWFTVVPLFGGFLAFVVRSILLVVGIKERYRVSGRRAALVVLAPYFLLFLGVFLLGIFAFFVLSHLPFQEYWSQV